VPRKSKAAKATVPAAAEHSPSIHVEIDDKARMKWLGGSKSDDFNLVLVNAACDALWTKNSSPEWRERQRTALAAAMAGIAPQDELEGMLAGQLVAANAAAMESFRRAMHPDQTFVGRNENLNHANKLSRTYVTLLEALNRHRGKGGQQKVTVEHVHVYEGGQAVVGAVDAAGMTRNDKAAGGGQGDGGNRRQTHAKAIAHAPIPSLRSEDEERETLPVGGDAER
jgi:hypothetical protein